MSRKSWLWVALVDSLIAPMGCTTAQAEAQSQAQLESVQIADGPVCDWLAETSQVGCSGTLTAVGQMPVNVQVTVPYHCEGLGALPPPGLASGESGPLGTGGDRIAFHVATEPALCSLDHPAVFGTTADLTVIKGSEVVLKRGVMISRMNPQPGPQQ